jgi:peptidoglycan hydrolase-like protein with peptidoglycan-binding domain
MKTLRGLGLLALLLAVWTSAQAATIEVRSARELSVVTVAGELNFRDEEAFTDKVLRLRDAVVVFDSVGGNLVAGIEIGKAIRLKGFSTLVLDDTLCASACALAWLGGRTRWAAPRAKIAVHAAWMFRDGKKQETGSGNALVGAYLNTLGLTDEAIVFITGAAPDDAEFLSFQKAETLGIAVKQFGTGAEPQQAETKAEPEPSKPLVCAEPDARYYDPNARTLNPETAGPAQPAETRIAGLPPVWRPTEPEIRPQVLDLTNLDAAAQVQRRLQERAFFHGLIDGVWGKRSRIALRDFKIRNGLGADDRWDLQTQLAVFDDRYPVAPAAYVPGNPEKEVEGLFMPFAAGHGASLHPLNPGDALKIQSRLSDLGYYRKAGDGVWGMASRFALTDFKVANDLPPDDTWDGSVERAMQRPQAVQAVETPFGEWVQPGTACGDPNNPRRLVISAKAVTAGLGSCALDPPLQRSQQGWTASGVCTQGAASAPARVSFQVLRGRLVDRSVVGSAPNDKPAVFNRCM